jgi:hypothetical protein
MEKSKSRLLLKAILLGLLIAVLVYIFHPATGHFNLTINGQPVSNPLARFAAVPTFLVVLLVTGTLAGLALLGMGMFLFIGILLLGVVVILFAAPYFWPMLVIIVLVFALASIAGEKKNC